MSDDQAFARIGALLEELAAFPATRLTLQTTLWSDAGMDGDDANEFLCRFADEFAVDLSTFRFTEHFNSEGLPFPQSYFLLLVAISCGLCPWLIPAWALVFWLRAHYFPQRKAEIRIFDLLRSVTAGRWIYDYPTA